jgi:phage/plasmid-like protein (TIGR03299 family)
MHNIYFNELNNSYSFAYSNRERQVPWHGLGQELNPDDSLETWAKNSGMDFEIKKNKLFYEAVEKGELLEADQVALVRTDTKKLLGIVSPDYNIFQPFAVLSFFNDLITLNEFEMDTAGVLFEGKAYFAMGKNVNFDFDIEGDQYKSRLIVVTGADGKRSTRVYFTLIRVVCANTLSLSDKNFNRGLVYTQTHKSEFDADKCKLDLGLYSREIDKHAAQLRRFSNYKMNSNEVKLFFKELYNLSDNTTDDKKLEYMMRLYYDGAGANNKAGTALRLFNTVTEFETHGKKKVKDNSAKFLKGLDNNNKSKAFDNLVLLAA